MQAVADEQDTPVRMLAPASEGFGVDWSAHFVPFQCSARVTSVPDLL